ncbi:uncharacterized protein LOC115327764 [Ixodes scapularis]|uniref:uncharacterized protein LOC115324204 n=1 Tax=Ixodes scapularis TaxID=6945 RepID=UPI001AD701DB|nr:uncharacterized protein LOC115324204 [Ixodes scapularis]XP_040073896.2 uncharacterized protein LOC115327764 [Ixodes scapularis]
MKSGEDAQKAWKRVRDRATTNVKAPPVGDTAQCLLMEMVESSPDDSTIPTDFEPAQEELQCSPEAPVPATPSTSVVSTSSTSRRSSGQSQRCPGPPHSARRREVDAMERELLNHLRTKMTQNEAFAYSVAQSLDRWDEVTSAQFRACVMQIVYEYECKFQQK